MSEAPYSCLYSNKLKERIFQEYENMLRATNKKFDSLDECNSYNKENSFRRFEDGFSYGCIGSFCCEGCFTVLSDSVCCCAWVSGYDCPSCGHKATQVEFIETTGNMDNIKPREIKEYLSQEGVEFIRGDA